MVGFCVAYGCSNRQKSRSVHGSDSRTQDLTFHYFPKDSNIAKKWLAAIRRENFKPSSTSRICSEHFRAGDFDDDGFRRRLRKGVVPSVFKFPPHLVKTTTPRRPLLRQLPQPSEEQVQTQNAVERIAHDHGSYTSKTDQATALKQATSQLKALKGELRSTKQRLSRKVKTTKKLKGYIKQILDKNLIEKEAFTKLTEAFGDIQCVLFKHLISSSKSKKAEYVNKIKAFAVTLHFLSPKAYKYLRPVLMLPHPATLRTWRSSVYCQPGYLDNMLSLAAGKISVNDEGSRFCSLIIDEMSIRRDTSWCKQSHRYVGFEDYGGGPVNKTVARNSLVFLLVGLKQHWKVPMAYFLTEHMDGPQLQRTIIQAISRAAEFGLIVKTVVADGLRTNMKAAKLLGCDFSLDNLTTSFPHPTLSAEKVYFVCDPPHMLKLVRNLLGERLIIKRKTAEGQTELIQWHFLEQLHELQSKESLYLANKLRSQHIHFGNVKMKVNIAAQTLSSSVASAIDHLRDDCKLKQFEGSEATTAFLRFFDKLFDCLNARNPYAKGYKAALAKWNRHVWTKFLIIEAPSYIKTLQDANGESLLKGQRSQGMLGFLITAKSAEYLATEVINRGAMDYLLPYKFSQDHIEMFFNKIRQRGGNNNNPTSEQFKSAMKSLMLQNQVSASSFGNATSFGDDNFLCLEFSSKKQQLPLTSNPPLLDLEMEEAARILESALFKDSDWRQSCLVYTAGFVVRRLRKQVTCKKCLTALTTETSPGTADFAFLDRKNNGGLLKPSEGVIQAIISSEKAFRMFMPSPERMTQLPSTPMIDLHIQRCVLNGAKDSLSRWFPSLIDHHFDHEFQGEDDHVSQLVRRIVAFYIRMRLLKAGRMHQRRVIFNNKPSQRMKFTKLILFSGQ